MRPVLAIQADPEGTARRQRGAEPDDQGLRRSAGVFRPSIVVVFFLADFRAATCANRVTSCLDGRCTHCSRYGSTGRRARGVLAGSLPLGQCGKRAAGSVGPAAGHRCACARHRRRPPVAASSCRSRAPTRPRARPGQRLGLPVDGSPLRLHDGTGRVPSEHRSGIDAWGRRLLRHSGKLPGVPAAYVGGTGRAARIAMSSSLSAPRPMRSSSQNTSRGSPARSAAWRRRRSMASVRDSSRRSMRPSV